MSSELERTLSMTSAGARAPGARPAPYLFLCFRADRPLEPLARFDLSEVDVVELGRGPELVARRDRSGEMRRLVLSLPDARVSSRHGQLLRVLDRWLYADHGSKNGSLLDGRRVERGDLADSTLLAVGQAFFTLRTSEPAGAGDLILRQPAASEGLTTLLPSLAASFGTLAAVAGSPVSVIVQGQSGSGKEVVAREVHRLSGRPGDFVAVNCGAIPEELVESELFGHRRGAFSGALEDRPGLLRSASGGTLFLDEIGDLPLASQAAFLRVLQEQEVRPVGGVESVKVDLRIVAATHRPLERMVEEGRFRADLFARLSGYALDLPPLAARREDLGIITQALLLRAGAPGVSFSQEAAQVLLSHRWPLNVRELEKVLGTARVVAGDRPITPEHLPRSVRELPAPEAGREPRDERGPPGEPRAERGGALDALRSASTPARRPRRLAPEDVQRRGEIEDLLRAHGGNISQVARAMGKARVQVQRWLKRYGLRPDEYK